MTDPTKKKPAHVFLDTSTLLSFYAFTNDDIDQLRNVKKSIEDGRLKLHLTQQVVDEFSRNRESKISEALENFRKQSDVKGALPRLLATYPAAKAYQETLHSFQKVRDELIAAAKKDAGAKQLPADTLFEELRSAVKVVQVKDEILSAAVLRHQLGNPPGKADGPLGDRINWECLLATVPDGCDLHVVTRDGDFTSPLDKNRVLQFIADEWKERKESELYGHSEVRIFLNQLLKIEFEGLKQEKNAALEALQYSGSFASTHARIEALSPYIELLEPADIVALAEAAVSNNQIGWIAQDDDVRAFYTSVVLPHLSSLEPELQKNLVELFGPEKPDAGLAAVLL